MLINELSQAKQQELARELRRLIEPDKAHTTRIIKEAEIRKELSKSHLTYYGLSDLKNVLKTNYSEKTISRLVSKVQKSIVWDTCLCNLSSQEITDLLFNSDYENIIVKSVYDELLKLVISNCDHDSSENAFRLITNILEDTGSNFCSVIDLPPKMSENKYVDNQLLAYCKQNDYILYTHDYVLGLRAKSRKIDVKIFTHFQMSDIEQYEPTSTGKNIILDNSLLNHVTISDIVTTAKSIKGNKFILTQSFIECLESYNTKRINRDLINFFVADADNNYSLYVSDNEIADILKLTEKYNAIVFTPDVTQCITYKTFFIPYKIVYPQDMDAFKKLILETLKSSPYCNCDDIDLKNLEARNSESMLDPIVEQDNAQFENQKNSTDDDNVDSKSNVPNNQLVQLPHYSPQTHQLNIKKLMPNERMWVLDETSTELSPDAHSKIKVYLSYTIVHAKNNLNNTYNLTVYKLINRSSLKCCSRNVSVLFDKDNIESCVPLQYQRFARLATRLT